MTNQERRREYVNTFLEWLQIGAVTLEPDGGARGALGLWISAEEVAALMGPEWVKARLTVNHDPGDEDR